MNKLIAAAAVLAVLSLAVLAAGDGPARLEGRKAKLVTYRSPDASDYRQLKDATIIRAEAGLLWVRCDDGLELVISGQYVLSMQFQR